MNSCNFHLRKILCTCEVGKSSIRLLVLLSVGVSLLFAGNTSLMCTENGTLSGRVVDVSQNPVPGVEVFVYTHNNIRRPADYISPPTNKNGEFHVTLPPGIYWTVARLRHGENRFGPLSPGDKHSGSPLEVEIAPGENVEEEFVIADLEETSQLTVKTDTSFIKVEGVLLTKKGLPVENAYAFANRNPTMKKIPDYVSAWSDWSGRYTLFLPPGIYYLRTATEFPPGSKPGEFKKVVVDSTVKNINIVIDE